MIHAILDSAFLCHVGYVIEGQPYVTPTAYWADGDTLYWHGSSASRILRAQLAGIPVCLTVAILDALVIAQSAFYHSLNYRSVMAFGSEQAIEGRTAKLASMEAFVERVFSGRWAELQPPLEKEIKATSVLAMPIDEASAKIRTGPPVDDDDDYALRIWAGLVDLATVVTGVVGDGRGAGAGAPPPHLSRHAPGANLTELLRAAVVSRQSKDPSGT